MRYRWDKCIKHYDCDVDPFLKLHFSETHRKVLLIAGAGFDPRAKENVLALHEILGNRLECIFIKEERPEPDPKLVQKANENLDQLTSIYPASTVIAIDIFADDNAVVGGINIIKSLQDISIDGFTDLIVDFSALSIGVSFPIVKCFFDLIVRDELKVNIHLLVISNPSMDGMICSVPNDRATEIRGFARSDRLYGEADKAKLWLPQLSGGRKEVLRRIHDSVVPHDVCPIVPFPSGDVKKGDNIVIDFITELESEWRVDKRNYVYADENQPLDIYRTILKIDDQRRPVFQTFGGSVIILSPLGSKLLAIGALMAALERKFPIVYVEALEYTVDWEKVDLLQTDTSKKAHIWLYGEAYQNDFTI
ncbi:hypothetical protein KI811_16245 [Geobacter hydrogenophilus]|uniref:Uncharacterized protein n=1 Tax=Geobacter hydrogenophilus TaxID=40983 RepID=A0A9W6LEI6_9BACT|nr:hypothetical protein [Geobacter hydrogenophilus]MBT0895359.1 hypothetical protein [Geobacter hydrogenophilus]GLI39586.1 hypothetical protein GHYDROH2_30870 [Geobacter hydrogenophilus]